MLKFLKASILASSFVILLTNMANAQDADAGRKVFKKCRSCHMIGEGAKKKVGPHLNDVLGGVIGSQEGFKYSNALKKANGAGLVWDDANINEFLLKPKKFLKGTKMGFAGLRKEKDRQNIIAYLKQFSKNAVIEELSAEPVEMVPKAVEPKTKPEANNMAPKTAVVTATVIPAKDRPIPKHGVLHLGRIAMPEEVKAWDIDIRPDGKGLPNGKGSVAQGELIYTDNCASCHGDFGEGTGRWPILAGGHGTLTEERPEKTIGSFWPYLSTVYDYVRRAMPFGNARSLSNDDVYALTAYLLFLNDVVTDTNFELSKDNFTRIKLQNEANFITDTRFDEPQYNTKSEPCMSNCKPDAAKVTMRARVLDVTPDGDGEAEGAASIE